MNSLSPTSSGVIRQPEKEINERSPPLASPNLGHAHNRRGLPSPLFRRFVWQVKTAGASPRTPTDFLLMPPKRKSAKKMRPLPWRHFCRGAFVPGGTAKQPTSMPLRGSAEASFLLPPAPALPPSASATIPEGKTSAGVATAWQNADGRLDCSKVERAKTCR